MTMTKDDNNDVDTMQSTTSAVTPPTLTSLIIPSPSPTLLVCVNSNDSINYDIKKYYNMNIVDGIRCISCILVLMFHVHYVYGGSILIRTSTCYYNVFQFLPYNIGMYIFRITWQMTLFWLLSGFLCEYQLHQLYMKYYNQNHSKQEKQQGVVVEMKKEVEKEDKLVTSKQLSKSSSDNNNNNVNQKDDDDNDDNDEKMNLIDPNKEDDKQLNPKDNAVINNHNNNNNNNNNDRIYIPYHLYISFIMNRLLRLYPLYIILPIITYIHHNYYHESLYTLQLYTIHDLIKTLLLFMQWNENSPLCPSVGWTVQVDIHGYMFLILLFIGTYQYTYHNNTNNNITTTTTSTWKKRCILIILYIISIINVLSYKPLPEQNISKDASQSIVKYGIRGIDTSTDIQLILYSINKYGGSRQTLYTTIDFYNDYYQSIRLYRYKLVNTTYFASIFNHGSAILLGSLLYLNLYEKMKQRQQQQNRTQSQTQNNEELNSFLISCIKLLIVFIGLHISRGWHSISGIFMYFLMDVLLTMKYNMYTSTSTTVPNHNIFIILYNNIIYISNCITYYIIQFLSCAIFHKLAPYTYGIYLFHMVFIMKRYEISLPYRIEAIQNVNTNRSNTNYNIDDVCDALKNAGYEYNIQFIFRETIIIFMISLLFAIIMHYIIEKPILQLRQQYIKKSSSSLEKEQKGTIRTIKTKIQ